MLTDPTLRYGDLPEHLRRYRADIFDDKYHRLTWDDLSRSITAHIAKDGYSYIHPGEPRTLTVREAARIQTFPDRFRFAGSRSHAFAQIGNAVPPKLAAVMAGAVLTAVDREPPADQLQPSVWRAAIRTALLEWWNRRGGVALWQRVGDPWAVLVGTIFGRDRQIGGHPGAVGYLDRFPYPQNVTPAHSATFAAKAEDDKQQLAMRRLNGAGLLIKKDGWESDWCKAAGLGPAERLWVERIGLKADALLSTGRSLRVAARLTGTSVDRERSGSDGKIQLGLLVGSGSDVPHLNVALDTLGRDTCTSGIPRCNDCPLSELCASARVS
jgi:DNA (cytosine-5)-methyltransferase 1